MRGSDKRKVGSEEQQDTHDLAFLSKAAVGFLELSPDDDIYQFIGKQLKKLAGDSVIFVNSFDSATDKASVRTALGLGKKAEAMAKMLGRHPVGTSLSINEEARIGLSSGKLEKIPGGLYEFSFRRIPKTVCHAIEKLLDLGNIYAMGFTWKGNLFGSTSILTRKGTKLRNQTLIEAFIKQASVALQRQQAEEALQKAHEQLEIRVKERTKELAQANKQLRAEITERKQAEKTLRRSRASLAQAQQLAHMGNWDWNIVTNKMVWSDETYRIFGSEPQEFDATYETFLNLIHPDDREFVSKSVNETLHANKPYSLDYRIVLPDGSERVIHEQAETTFDETGRTIRMFGAVQDITERKQAEKTLKESEERYRSLVNLGGTVGEAIIMLQDTEQGDAIHTFVSKEWPHITGYSRKELFGMSLSDLLHPKYRQNSHNRHERKVSGETIPELFEMSIIRKDGAKVPIELTSAYTTYKGERANVAFIRDITKRRKMEKRLRESEEQYRDLFENANDLIQSVMPDGRFLYVNRAWCKALGYTQEEIGGLSLFDIIHPDSQAHCVELFQRVISGESVDRIEAIFVTKGGKKITVEGSANCRFVDGKPVATRGIFRNITKRKKMEKRLSKLYEVEKEHREELEEEKRVRGLSINVLAHELRTPLTPLLASATLLKDILPPGEERPEHELTNLIINGAETLASRLDELLDLARYTVGAFTINPQPLDIQAVLKKADEQHRELVKEKKQSIILDLPQRLPPVSGDRPRLEQVLTNLLSNATKFSPEGGSITIRAMAKGSKVVIEVEDRGNGLSPEEQERIFQPYHRVEQDRQRFAGLGLGLAICKQIVEAHKGRIWVESQLGHGSKFSFSLLAIRQRMVK